MKLTIHRGSHEVGGNCVELQSGDTRIILDVGLPLFGSGRQPLDSFALRSISKEHLLELGILPPVPGLFLEGATPDAILLSHGHLDHTGLIEHSNSSIPVYASDGTSKMMLAGKIFAGQVELKRERFRAIVPKKTFRIGNFAITSFPVDHSIFSCIATLIEADGKSLLYTGDVRMHGRKPGMMHELVESMKHKVIDILLMEGTHFGFPDGPKETEYETEAKITQLVDDAPGLVLASFSPQNVDRLVAFVRAAIKTNRIFVVDVYTAFVMHLIRNEIGLPQPGTDDLIRVFYPQAFEQSVARKRTQKISDLFIKSRIEWSEVFAAPSKYLMVFRPSMLRMDFGNELPRNTLCLYSRWQGYLDQEEWRETRKTLERTNGSIEIVHTSGHIFSTDILGFVNTIAPKRVIPIHTFEPQLFFEQFGNALLLVDGQTYEVV